MTSELLEAAEAYHAHLDVCEQCEQHPFDQCPEGARLLLAAGEAATGIKGAKLRQPKPRRKKKRRRDGKGKRRKR